MSVQVWWSELRPETREWLIANNGDAVPVSIVEEIAAAGGPARSEGWWVRDDEPERLLMPDEAVDWIEEIANDETPTAPR